MRFEMPFAIWCTTCVETSTSALIGQGVRFNAEKKKVGNYHSTPIFSFRMRHPACGGWIEIRTDPANTAYVVSEGARKRETARDGDDEDVVGEIRVVGLGGRDDAEMKAKEDAFARLEGKVEDKKRFDSAAARIYEIQKRQKRDWEDPYEQSRRLRKTFRAERRRLEGIDATNEALKDKMSLAIDLLAETEEDRIRAAMVDFGSNLRGAQIPDGCGELLTSRTKPMFDNTKPLQHPSSGMTRIKKYSKTDTKQGKKSKSEALLAERKALLSSELCGNTRAALDPFLNEDKKAWQPEIIKRRKQQSEDSNTADNAQKLQSCRISATSAGIETGNSTSPAPCDGDTEITQVHTESKVALVNYGSDSD